MRLKVKTVFRRFPSLGAGLIAGLLLVSSSGQGQDLPETPAAPDSDILDNSTIFRSFEDQPPPPSPARHRWQLSVGGGTQTFASQLAYYRLFAGSWQVGGSLEYQEKQLVQVPSRFILAEFPVRWEAFPDSLLSPVVGAGLGYEKWYVPGEGYVGKAISSDHQEDNLKAFAMLAIQLKLAKHIVMVLQHKQNHFVRTGYFSSNLVHRLAKSDLPSPISLYFAVRI